MARRLDSAAELSLARPLSLLSERRVELTLGLTALVVVLSNAVWHWAHGRWFDAFWLCNAAAIAGGVGLLSRSRLLVTMAFIWLVPGTLAWSIEALLLGSTFSAASYALHLGGTVAAAYGVRSLGAHPRGYLGAVGLLGALLALSRWLPVDANVNCAFGPRAGWWVFEWLPLPHLVSVAAMALALSFTLNQLALLFSGRRTRSPDPRS